MVFKGRFFSSKKSESSSSPDGSSNSPRSFGSNSPSRSDKKKSKSHKEDEHRHQISGLSASFYSTPSKQAAKDKLKHKDDSKHLDSKKDFKAKDSPIEPSSKPILASGSSVSPILASSLGLNKIKTRSGPLPQESFFGFRSEKSAGASNLSRPAASAACAGPASSKKEAPWLEIVAESGSNSDSMSPGSGPSTGRSPSTGNAVQPRSRLSSEAGQFSSLHGQTGSVRHQDACTPEGQIPFDCETPKESESPRFQAIMRVTSGPKKRFPADIKSFSHELNSKGVRPFPFWKRRGLNNVEEVLVMIRGKFDKAKEEVDSDLAVFAADLVGVLEKNAETHPEEGFYKLCLLTLYLMGPPTFLSLQFLTAPYGRHVRSGWGPTIPAPLAWFLMEGPTVYMSLLIFPHGRHRASLRSLALLSVFLLHYTNRTLLYPLRLRRRAPSSRFPVSVALAAFLFNLLNSYVQARWVSHYGDYAAPADPWFWPRFAAGFAVFAAGMALNVWSDGVLVRLKAESGGGYRVPRGGAYELVSCPNYLGEIVEWLGWALMTFSWAGLGFFLYTCANLVPRARANHVWYLQKFSEDYPTKRKAVFPFLY